jgi:membrane protein YdbS with pleckstrin-like domain
MDFLNHQVDLAGLPKIEEVTWQKVEEKYLHVIRLRWVILTLVILVALIITGLLNPLFQTLPWIIILGSAGLAISLGYLVIQQLAFSRMAYVLRDHDILYRHGLLIRSTEACPFNRRQHCSVSSGPLERKFGLASLSIYTAASVGADFSIPGLTEATAVSLRELIMKKIIPYEGQGN